MDHPNRATIGGVQRNLFAIALAALCLIGSGSARASTITPRPPGQLNYAAVVVLPPAPNTSTGTVLLPDGSTLNVSGSNTAGLQEAIKYANDGGWDVFVYGAGRYSSSGTYNLSSPLLFPAMQGKTIRFMNVDLEFGPAVWDAALVFDSCMMVDVELTGQISAPYANYGVRYQAVSPFPLDGALNGAHGIAASRFEFEQIYTRVNGLYFGQRADNSAFFAGMGTASVGPQPTPCYNCIFESVGAWRKSHLHDTSVSLDMLNPTGVVVLPPTGPMGNPGTVVVPNGLLDTTGTQTAGLQEAITYALSSNLDLAIYGRGLQVSQIKVVNGKPQYPNNGFYEVNAQLQIPPVAGRTLRIYNATLNYGITAGFAIEASSATDFEFELTGQIVAPGSAMTGMMLSSTRGPIRDTVWKVGSILSGWINFELQTQDTPLMNNVFLVREPNGGQYGIMLRSTQGQPISGNYIRSPNVHRQAVGGVDFKDPAVYSNRFDVAENSEGITQWSIGIGGSYNTVYDFADAPIVYYQNGPGNSVSSLASQPALPRQWTPVPAAGLPSGNYVFLYYQPTSGNWYLTPQATTTWSWNSFNQVTGNYLYGTSAGATGSFTCNGGESGSYGVGCSNGGGATSKVLPIYSSAALSSSGEVCQDQPGLFGPACQTGIDIYYAPAAPHYAPTAPRPLQWSPIPASGLPSGPYVFLYYEPLTGNWYQSPAATTSWSWNSFNQVTGTYLYGTDAGTTGSITCNGGERGSYGVGCSTGPGPTSKVLPIYSSSPSTSTGEVCQDRPGLFGAPCGVGIELYYAPAL